MLTAILAFLVMAALVAAMAIGVLLGREPIKGSCGGMAALGIDTECEICGGNPQLCETEQKKDSAPTTDLAYEVKNDKEAG